MVKSRGRIVFVRADEVDWFEAAGNYVALHAGAKLHLVRGTMSALESRLDPGRFQRVHRSTIVRLDRVRELRAKATFATTSSSSGTEQLYHSAARITVSYDAISPSCRGTTKGPCCVSSLHRCVPSHNSRSWSARERECR